MGIFNRKGKNSEPLVLSELSRGQVLHSETDIDESVLANPIVISELTGRKVEPREVKFIHAPSAASPQNREDAQSGAPTASQAKVAEAEKAVEKAAVTTEKEVEEDKNDTLSAVCATSAENATAAESKFADGDSAVASEKASEKADAEPSVLPEEKGGDVDGGESVDDVCDKDDIGGKEEADDQAEGKEDAAEKASEDSFEEQTPINTDNDIADLSAGAAVKRTNMREEDYCALVDEYARKLAERKGCTSASESEKKTAVMLRDLVQETLGAPTRLEPFKTNSLRGRGMLPVFGTWYLLCLLVYFIQVGGAIASLIMMLVGTAPIILLVFGKLRGVKILNDQTSYNVACVLGPQKQDVKRTVVIGCNYDSKLGHFYEAKRNIMPTLQILCVFSIIALAIFAIFKIAFGADTKVERLIFAVAPVFVCSFPIILLMTYNSHSKKFVEQNNGISTMTSLVATKYFVDHPELVPANTRLVFVAFGSEYNSASGSYSFVKRHLERDHLLINPVFVGLGEIRNSHFTVLESNGIKRVANDKAYSDILAEVTKRVAGGSDNYTDGIMGMFNFSSEAFSKAGIPSAELWGGNLNLKPRDEVDKQLVDGDLIKRSFRIEVLALKRIMDAMVKKK